MLSSTKLTLAVALLVLHGAKFSECLDAELQLGNCGALTAQAGSRWPSPYLPNYVLQPAVVTVVYSKSVLLQVASQTLRKVKVASRQPGHRQLSLQCGSAVIKPCSKSTTTRRGCRRRRVAASTAAFRCCRSCRYWPIIWPSSNKKSTE